MTILRIQIVKEMKSCRRINEWSKKSKDPKNQFDKRRYYDKRKRALNNIRKLSNIHAPIRILAFADEVHKHRIISPSISFETQTHVHEITDIKQSIKLATNTWLSNMKRDNVGIGPTKKICLWHGRKVYKSNTRMWLSINMALNILGT
jgi:zona occludens toxin (predicted ATPase)